MSLRGCRAPATSGLTTPITTSLRLRIALVYRANDWSPLVEIVIARI